MTAGQLFPVWDPRSERKRVTEHEKTLDIPAIDMTDGSTQGRPRESPTDPKPSQRTGLGSASRTKKTRHGSVGTQTYARVNEIIEAERISKREAFERVGKELKSNRGTVAANYYRVAKAQAASPTTRERPRSQTSASKTPPPTTPAGQASEPSIDDIANELTRTISALLHAVKLQNREVAQLRTRLDGV